LETLPAALPREVIMKGLSSLPDVEKSEYANEAPRRARKNADEVLKEN